MAMNNAVIKERSDGSSEYWAERFEEASGWVEHYVDESNRLAEQSPVPDGLHPLEGLVG